MITPDDLRARLCRVGLNPDEYTAAVLRDIAHDIRDEHPRGCTITNHAFRRIALRNRDL